MCNRQFASHGIGESGKAWPQMVYDQPLPVLVPGGKRFGMGAHAHRGKAAGAQLVLAVPWVAHCILDLLGSRG